MNKESKNKIKSLLMGIISTQNEMHEVPLNEIGINYISEMTTIEIERILNSQKEKTKKMLEKEIKKYKYGKHKNLLKILKDL